MSGKQSTTEKTVVKKQTTPKNQIPSKSTELSVAKQKENAINNVLKHAAFLNKAQESLNWYTKKLFLIDEMMKENAINLESFKDDFSIVQDESKNNLKIKLEKKVGYKEDSIVSIDDPRIVQMFMQFLFEYFEKKKETVVSRILEEEEKYKS